MKRCVPRLRLSYSFLEPLPWAPVGSGVLPFALGLAPSRPRSPVCIGHGLLSVEDPPATVLDAYLAAEISFLHAENEYDTLRSAVNKGGRIKESSRLLHLTGKMGPMRERLQELKTRAFYQ